MWKLQSILLALLLTFLLLSYYICVWCDNVNYVPNFSEKYVALSVASMVLIPPSAIKNGDCDNINYMLNFSENYAALSYM